MNKRGKSWRFFAMAALIIAFSLSALFGFSYQYGDTKTTYVKGAADIRFGIDIRGGVDVTFMPADDMDATDAQMAAAGYLWDTAAYPVCGEAAAEEAQEG